MNCRHCQAPLEHSFLDLGTAPPSNSYLSKEKLSQPELYYPLRVMVCDQCWLVQTEDFAQADQLFDAEYAYFSGFSSSWLQHSESYVNDMVGRFSLDETSHVIEIASNDGYLLQYVKDRGIPCTGVEPTASTAAVARGKGIETIEEFFGVTLAQTMVERGLGAALTVANNVLAHVPDINDFVSGFRVLLKPDGVATFEFPHLMRLISETQFDTVYHEHFSYLSLTAVKQIFEVNGLNVFDVQELTTHGGSLRVFAQRSDRDEYPIQSTVAALLAVEEEAGLTDLNGYSGFQPLVASVKDTFLSFLIQAKKEGKRVAAYGAAAKGNTFMNYAGISSDLIEFVADKNPAKQGKFMPGSRIPIVNEERIHGSELDYVVILPWNLKDEISEQLDYIKDWGGKFVVAVPELMIL